MARKKNLSKENADDVSTYEDYTSTQFNRNNKQISIHDLSIKIKCLNGKQKTLKKAIEDNEITISIGPAGTGKTYLSLITALHLLKTHPIYKRILLVKSLTTIKGEDPGFLPGTLREKMAPFMYSFIGNIDKILHSKITTSALMDEGIIEVIPIAYIRGNTIDEAIIIIDETQNIDMHAFKTIITRIGRNTKMIFLGDVEQIDRDNKSSSCLLEVFKMFEDKDFIATIEFNDSECVRHPIIPKILEVMGENHC